MNIVAYRQGRLAAKRGLTEMPQDLSEEDSKAWIEGYNDQRAAERDRRASENQRLVSN